MKLLGTKVAVKQEESKLTTKGGIALPESTKSKLPQGEVVAIGCEIETKQRKEQGFLTLMVGSHVLFNNFAVQAVNVDGQDYAIIDVTDIQVIL